MKSETKKMVGRLKEVTYVCPELCSIHGYEVSGGKQLTDFKMVFHRDDEHVKKLIAKKKQNEKKPKKPTKKTKPHPLSVPMKYKDIHKA